MQTTVANIKYNEKEKNICFMHNYLKIQFTKLKRPALVLIWQYSYKTTIGKYIGAIQNVCLEGGGLDKVMKKCQVEGMGICQKVILLFEKIGSKLYLK